MSLTLTYSVILQQVYQTMGTVRHVFGKEKMQDNTILLHKSDVWVSMVENWADCVKEYKRECEAKGLWIRACLPKISKNLFRVVHSMQKLRHKLPDAIEGNSAFKSDLANMDTVIPIVQHWYNDFKRKVSTFVWYTVFLNFHYANKRTFNNLL